MLQLRVGNLEMLEWLHSAGCPWDANTAESAAESGNLELLQCLHSAGFPWNNEYTCRAAADVGSREMLQWVIDHGCPEPMDDKIYEDIKNRIL
jgi:hypothetical protein